jgi:hypothetical protein
MMNRQNLYIAMVPMRYHPLLPPRHFKGYREVNIFIIAGLGGRVHPHDIPTQTNAGLDDGYN